MAMVMALSFTSYADDGVTSSVEETGFSFEMPVEAPVVEEPVVEEPTPEPTPAPVVDEPAVEEPTPEPQPVVEEPVVEEPTPEPAPAPTPVVEEQQPSNDGNNDQPAPAADETPATTETPVVTPVSTETPVETPVVAQATKRVVRAAAPTTSVLGVTRAAKAVPEDVEVEVEEVVEEEPEGVYTTPWELVLALLLALIALIGIALYLLGLGRKYEVVLRETDENGEQTTESLKKFFSCDKAAEYIRDYLYDNQDSDYVLNLYNNSRDGEEELEDGSKIQKDFVYYVSKDRSAEMILWADDDEVDAIERILGFVSVEA